VSKPAPSESISDLLDACERPLVAYASRITGDVDRAREVVQDTFCALLEADRASIDGHVRQWLYTVCRNRAISVRRKDDRMQPLTDQHPPATAPRSAAGPERREVSRGALEALEALPERQQEVLRLSFQGGLSYKEIAGVLDTSVSNVGYMMHVGLKALREAMRPASEGRTA
jgi:RNA polymerase sigma-70 factor (ECF subfamily)